MARQHKRYLRPLLAMTVVLLLALSGYGNAYAQAHEDKSKDEDAIESFSFASVGSFHAATYEAAWRYSIQKADETYYLLYHDYVMSRIVPLIFPETEPMSFGPWDARIEHGTDDAAADGSLTEWADAYYITHDWSDYGQQILTMCPQDTVSINGVTFEVEDAFDYPKDGYLEEVRDIVGDDTVVIQTCEPSSDLNRIVYGRPS